jgi:putative membrane protein insertion efficiency factor
LNKSKKTNKSFFSYFIISLINFYQFVTLPFKPSCRFFPTCSEYAKEAFGIHGIFIGARLTLIRIFNCRPFGKSGIDPVPENLSKGRTNGH